MGAKAPAPTDPRETSAATTGTNLSTAIGNAWMTNMNEYGPDGSREFNNTGMETVTDPYTGQTYQVPRFSVTTTLSPEQQAIKTQQDGASLNLATLGSDLSGTLADHLRGNFTIGNEATEARLFDLGRTRLDPLFAQRDEDLRSRLASQGIKAGSAAYDREMALLGQNQNDAYNQLLLTGRGQAVNEQLTEDNQRINQISALLGGGQVSQPMFSTNPNVTPMATTDNGSIIANYDKQNLASWQQNQANLSSLLGGIGGLFSLSDENAKEDMEKIAETDDGIGIFKFRYKGSPKTQIGLKAQDVAKKKPRAVAMGGDGLMRVNYGEAV
ncbi:hypothetical protein [EBPR podovirus 2]|nr:hypothetical protein [EBPR podovirus 2]